MEEILRMEHISKQFGDFYANRDITFGVRKGEVHTLLGENGAGKSTLMNVLVGLYQPTAGRILINGKPVRIESPAQAVRLGIGMVHQHFMLIEAMTVLQNIILGDTRDKGLFIQHEERKQEIVALSQKYGLDVDPDAKITDISVGAQQRVEILKALFRGAEILVLDEPTAVLTDIEVEKLYAIIDRLKGEGKSIVFISHKMREVLHVSDRITILRAGKAVCTLDADKTDGRELASLMIGRELSESNYKKIESEQEPVIELVDVDYNKSSKHNGLNGITLKVRRGEIVGVAGVDGNGQSQLAQIVTGVICAESGEVVLKGRKVSHVTAADFIAQNVSHIPEDRNRMGLIGDMTVEENLLLKSTQKCEFCEAGGWRLKKKAMKAYTDEMRDKYDIRCRSGEQEIRSLSGGNQQKVILARELEAQPDLLVAVHPTRGLDIGATRYVRDAMVAARDKGCAVLLISADFDEVLQLSDRIVVMFEGRIMGEYPGENPPVQAISYAMTGK